MKTEHTPGPWKAVANRPDEDHGKLDRIVGPDGRIVAGIPYYEHDQEQENANARLIAAAPRLLQLLQDGELQFSRLTGESLEAYARTFAAIARAAIAKATKN